MSPTWSQAAYTRRVIDRLKFLRRFVPTFISLAAFVLLLIAIPDLSRDLAYHGIIRAQRCLHASEYWSSKLIANII